MAEKLTAQQQIAVENRGGKLLVSAAAGSGKTKVLVDRLLSYLLDPDKPANLDDFLIITFTKAAAAELRGKIASKLSEKIGLMPHNRHLQQQLQRLYLAQISTVHSFCSDVLRQYAYRLDIPADFRIAEDTETQEMQLRVLEHVLDHAYATLGDHPDFRAFVDTQGFGRDDYLISEIILKTYESARCHLNPDEWLQWCVDAFDVEGVSDASETVWGKFLIEDLRTYVNSQMCALERCIHKAETAEGMEKPIALLQNTMAQLKTLYNCTTWNEIVAAQRIDYGRLTFSKKCSDPELAEKIKLVRKNCKKGLDTKLHTFADSSEHVLKDLENSRSVANGLVMLVKEFALEYEACKRARRVMDYGDLEHKVLDLLLGKNRKYVTAIASEIAERFREIMVDEYQDTNEVQDAIFDVLTKARNNCFMVGDVKQSIYQFRLADPDIFIQKYNSFVPAESAKPGEGRKVLLSSNFRSSGGVIEAVNHVFSGCMSPAVGGLRYTEDEMLREGLQHIPLPEPEVELHAIDVQEDTYAEEASFVAAKVMELLDGKHYVRDGETLRPIVADDIVILLRSPGSVGAHFVYELEQRGICCTTGKGTDLLKADEVCTLRAMLQIISNPLQDIPLLAVLMSPVFAFSADELAVMRSKDHYSCIYELLQRDQSEKTKTFLQTLTQLRQDARRYPLSQLIQRIFLLTDMDSIYSAMANGEVRGSNLQAFYQVASEFETTSKRDLNQFLSYLDTVEENGLRYGANEKVPGAVTIMSIHTSKGLEFPVVILAALSRKFNLENARSQILCDKDLGIGMCCTDSELRVRYSNIARRAIARKIIADSISEEMRILYVAMTRARDRLIMTYAVNNLQKDIQEMVTGLDMYDPLLRNAYVNCAGVWVMQSALCRTEAGQFFAVGGYPDNVSVQFTPWKITIAGQSICETQQTKSKTVQITDAVPVQKIRESLNFAYPYSKAIGAPSKLTATQLKGRTKDLEAAEYAEERRPVCRNFRKATFTTQRMSPQRYGNAVHTVMQYLNFSKCSSEDDVSQEIDRLVAAKFITEEQSAMIDASMIVRLFNTDLGKKLSKADTVLREFKFSILDDAKQYVDGLEDEKVLLQGVIDCAIIEPDGITLIDFKTDRVSEDNIQYTSYGYSGQVLAYANALKRIYQLPIKSAWLYFFQLNRFVSVAIN